MKSKAFYRVLIILLVVCVVFTAIHIAYAVYAYQYSSIIQFIAKELW